MLIIFLINMTPTNQIEIIMKRDLVEIIIETMIMIVLFPPVNLKNLLHLKVISIFY